MTLFRRIRNLTTNFFGSRKSNEIDLTMINENSISLQYVDLSHELSEGMIRRNYEKIDWQFLASNARQNKGISEWERDFLMVMAVSTLIIWNGTNALPMKQ